MALFFFLLAQASCGIPDNNEPSPTPPPVAQATATDPLLPDLQVGQIRVRQRMPELCPGSTNPLGIAITLLNTGNAPAGPFDLRLNDSLERVSEGLEPGEEIERWIEGVPDQSQVQVDASREVEESDEGNNSLTRSLAIPTLSPACLPPPTPVIPVMEPLATLEGHTGRVLSVAFSPDGSLVASGSVDNTMRLWRTQPASLLRTMLGHPFPVLTLAFSPNGAQLASGSQDGLVRLWRVSDGAAIRTLTGHSGRVLSLAFAPNGLSLASCGEDFTIRLWRIADGRSLLLLDEGMTALAGISFSPDGRRLAFGESTGMLRVWNIPDERWDLRVRESDQPVTSVLFSPDGRWLVSGHRQGALQVWDAQDGSLVQTLNGHTGAINSLAFSPDGLWMVSASADQTLRLWRAGPADTADAPDAPPDGFAPLPAQVYAGHTEAINAVAISPKGSLIASASDDETIRLWALPSDVEEEQQE